MPPKLNEMDKNFIESSNTNLSTEESHEINPICPTRNEDPKSISLLRCNNQSQPVQRQVEEPKINVSSQIKRESNTHDSKIVFHNIAGSKNYYSNINKEARFGSRSNEPLRLLNLVNKTDLKTTPKLSRDSKEQEDDSIRFFKPQNKADLEVDTSKPGDEKLSESSAKALEENRILSRATDFTSFQNLIDKTFKKDDKPKDESQRPGNNLGFNMKKPVVARMFKSHKMESTPRAASSMHSNQQVLFQSQNTTGLVFQDSSAISFPSNERAIDTNNDNSGSAQTDISNKDQFLTQRSHLRSKLNDQDYIPSHLHTEKVKDRVKLPFN